MAGIKDVALRAGVSISTVSRVMNSSKTVSPELAEKVRNAIEELDYSTNLAAHSLRSQKSHLIAVIVTSLSRPFFTDILEGINEIAVREGYTVLLAETHDDLDTEIRLVSEFAARCVDGIILASSAYGKSKKTEEYIASLEKLEKHGAHIPVVTLEFAFAGKDLSAVMVDNERSAFEAVSYLIRDLGRRHVIHISLPKEHLLGQQRARGYKRALAEAGIPDEDCVLYEGNYTTYSGYKLVRKLIAEKVPCDALFCANDQMAVGAILACNELSVRIPEEIAIIGNDDIFAASLVRPSLTSIRVPRHDIGVSAMKVLTGHMESEKWACQKLTLRTELVKRSSTETDYVNDLKNVIW